MVRHWGQEGVVPELRRSRWGERGRVCEQQGQDKVPRWPCRGIQRGMTSEGGPGEEDGVAMVLFEGEGARDRREGREGGPRP